MKLEKFWIKKRGRKLSRKGLVKKLDDVFSKFIRARDSRCVICGTMQDLTNGHLFSRVAYSTRWSEINCHCQCMSCNYKHELDAYPFTRWFIDHYGIEEYDRLHAEYKSIKKFKDFDIATL